MDGITGREDQERGEKISDEARAAIDENCLAWVRKVTGNPAATVLPLAQERVYEISDLVWSLAYRAGREDAAREERAKIAEEIAQAIEWTLTVPVEEARETYARRRATGDEDQAREWAIRLRAWKSARQMAAEAARGAGVQPTEDAARNALIIIGELDITTVVAALDRAGFDCPDDALGNASADLLQRLPVWQGSDGRYRPRIPKVDQPGVQPAEDGIDEQWSVWLTVPGGITVVTLADEQDDEPLNALGDVRRYDSDEEWARDYAANPPEGTLKAQVRRRTRTHWSAWQPVDQSGVQPTEEQRARSEDQNRDEEQR